MMKCGPRVDDFVNDNTLANEGKSRVTGVDKWELPLTFANFESPIITKDSYEARAAAWPATCLLVHRSKHALMNQCKHKIFLYKKLAVSINR
jgi:hypothetical protein